MKRKTAHLDIRVEPQLVERIDAWRLRQRVIPSRSAAVVFMIEVLLNSDEQSDKSWAELLKFRRSRGLPPP